MPPELPPDDADRFLAVALKHPECKGGQVLERTNICLRLQIDMHVEMPLHMKVDGLSDSGVRTIEPVTVVLDAAYPWSSPIFTLRDDFPRGFPHLQADPLSSPPRPCLVDGSQQEFFLQFGLLEAGVFHLIEQLALWLRRAAVSNLIDPAQGWEPMLRRDLRDVIVLDAESARDAVDRDGGYLIWQAQFYRLGPAASALGTDAWTVLSATTTRVALRNVKDDPVFEMTKTENASVRGGTIVAIIWPDKRPSGAPVIANAYLPESVRTLADLRTRADELGCGRSLETVISSLERRFNALTRETPVPVGFIFCARRPFPLIGSESPIELLPYVVDLRPTPGRISLFARGDAEPALPAAQWDSLNNALLRRVSGTGEQPALALLGCGSVGSKLALHAARTGQTVSAVNDNGYLRPHNLARHGLGPEYLLAPKAQGLADELKRYGQAPSVGKGDIAVELRDPERLTAILPKETGLVVNSTASLAVREALTIAAPQVRARLVEAMLFGRGNGALLLADGKDHNPSPADLVAEMYATITGRAAQLLFDPAEGLTEIQIGQSCGSLTMRMTDARLSAMTATVHEQLSGLPEAPDGLIVLGTTSPDGSSTQWSRQTVEAFTPVPIEGSEGWTLRLSPRIARQIRRDAAGYRGVETGGLLVGVSCERLKTVTAVDLIDAPADSRRSAGGFTLGTQGLQQAITTRHEGSGKTLFDVGTWHSHLRDEGPSGIDWATAWDLATTRTPPSVLLIATPRRFHALSARWGARGHG